MTLITKLISTGVGALTITGGLAGAIYFNNKGTETSEFLKKDDFILLTISNSDNVQWTKRWKEYIEQGENKWQLENYQSDSQNKNSAPESFKKTCVNRSKIKIFDTKDPNYDEVVKFCTKEFSISSILDSEGLEVITASDKQDAKWKKIWGEYLELVKDKNPLKLTSLESPSKDRVPDNYKDKCDAEKVKEVKNKKDENYLNIKSWCSTPKV